MADFCITAVKYDEDRKHIVRVRVREEKRVIGKDGLPRIVIGHWRSVARAFVADLIRLKKATFQTRTRNVDGTWALGSQVTVIDDEFLTTEPNKSKRDNLGELPEF